jgi:hypothetical protein
VKAAIFLQEPKHRESVIAQLAEEINKGIALLALVFFFATLLLPCLLRRDKKRSSGEERAPKQDQPASEHEPTEQAQEPREQEPREQEPREQEQREQEPREQEPREHEPREQEPREQEPRDVSKAGDRPLPDPYDCFQIYQPLLRSASFRSEVDREAMINYTAHLAREVEKWRARAIKGRTGTAGNASQHYELAEMATLDTAATDWKYHQSGPLLPPRQAQQKTYSAEQALPPKIKRASTLSPGQASFRPWESTPDQ